MLFRERAKSAYFRSASSDVDTKLFFVLGVGTRFLLALLLVSSQWPIDLRPKVLSLYEKYIEESIGL